VSNLSHLERKRFEDLFGMESGYVLDFSRRTFATFIKETVGKDIYSEKYSFKGDSKANRLRAFWEVETDYVVGQLLLALLEYWRYKNRSREKDAYAWIEPPLYFECLQISEKLSGKKGKEEESKLLNEGFREIPLEKLPIDSNLIPVLRQRFDEAIKCFQANAPLAVILLCGSILEGILLGIARTRPEEFNRANSTPKDDSGKVRPISDWSLSQMIDVACEVGLLTEDIKEFSHSLRNYRNYIHPLKQLSSEFAPDMHTAKMCLVVLGAAVHCLSGER